MTEFEKIPKPETPGTSWPRDEYQTQAALEGLADIARKATDRVKLLEQKSREDDATIERQKQEALHDVLIKTMLNKRGIEMRIENRIHSRSSVFGLFLIDLNNFNKVNNTFGHGFGDRVLLRFGELLNETLRRRTDEFNLVGENMTSDQARIGGDEFVVMVGLSEDYRREINPQRQMDKEYALLRTVETRLLEEFPELVGLGFGLSIGSTVHDASNPVSGEILLAQADEAMYEEKGEKSR